MDIDKALREVATDLSTMTGRGEDMAESAASGPSRIAFGTVVRTAPVEDGGELVVVDWDRKAVEARVPMLPRNPPVENDPNPRGNTRGCRGVQWHDGQLLAASYHTLEWYDTGLTREGAINDGLMAGLHEIEVTDDGTVWASATAIDAAVEYDLKTGERLRARWPREMPGVQEALGVRPLDIDKGADNRLRFLDPPDPDSHLHLNAVATHDGHAYALCNAHAAIVDLTAGEVCLRHDALQGGHNLIITEEGRALTNDTYGRAVCIFDLRRGTLLRTIDLTQYRWVRRLIRGDIPAYWARRIVYKAGWGKKPDRPLFVRGLARHDGFLFVGVSPAAVLQIDEASGALVDAYRYSSDVRVCVHGLTVLS